MPPALLAGAALCVSGCASHEKNWEAITGYYRYDFSRAREALRDGAGRNDEDVLLNNVRLGVAALADGDAVEAELALGRAFELLSTAGLNRDRTTAAVLFHEGLRIWKGEPFEQALSYYWVAALYATLGDWENVRAASANGLFRLTDFGRDQTPRTLARNAAADPEYLEQGYTAVDTDFALGFLLQGIGSSLSDAAGGPRQLQAALDIDGELAPIVDVLERGEYDTLILVDYGKGPTKIAYGPDDALVRFVPQERHRGRLLVTADGVTLGRFRAVCDVNRMAMDHRWNNLEDIRRAKSRIGRLLLAGGAITTAYGASERSEGAVAAGLAMMLAGVLSRAGARADTRYMEFAPQSVYLAPVHLGGRCELGLSVAGDPGSRMLLPGFEPGRPGDPRAVYLRLHGLDGPDPRWLVARDPVYGNDVTGVRDGDWPWILGGRDVSTPGPATLEAYQTNGFLPGVTLAELESLYRAEGITIGSAAGPDGKPALHILEGGRALYTPQPHSMGFKRLMYRTHAPYRPRSSLVRDLSPRLGPAGYARK